jgi:hypothetical protein
MVVSPNYLQEGVLGYSDADFLFALPYSGLHILVGYIYIFTSSLLTTVFLGWIGIYLFAIVCD